MQTTIINQKGLHIFLKTGREGPTYDPYHYEELTIERDGREFTVHQGLAEWIEVELPTYKNRVDQPKRGEIDIICERVTGFTLTEWRKIMRKKEEARYRAHRGHDVRSESGYPGESFTVCHTCGGEVLDSHFNESAII